MNLVRQLLHPKLGVSFSAVSQLRVAVWHESLEDDYATGQDCHNRAFGIPVERESCYLPCQTSSNGQAAVSDNPFRGSITELVAKPCQPRVRRPCMMILQHFAHDRQLDGRIHYPKGQS